MFKKIWFFSSVILLIFGLIYGLSAILSPEVLAVDTESESVQIEDVEDLNSLSIQFGATQNSLILSLDDPAGQKTINFALSEIEDKLPYQAFDFSQNDAQTFTSVELKYVAEFQENLSYRLKSPLSETDFSRPSFCDQQPQIIISLGKKISYDRISGYSQDWQNYDINDKQLQAKITLPLLNVATAINDDCLMLEEERNLNTPESKPFFTLIGNQEKSDSCEGLRLYGRGGDELEIPSTNWFCRDEVDELEAEAKDQFAIVESPPFDKFYIFIEDREGTRRCGGRILVNITSEDIGSDELILDAEWQDWHNDCKDGQYEDNKEQKRIIGIKVVNSLKRSLDADTVDDDPAGTINSGDTGSSGNPADFGNSCEVRVNSTLSWAVCPIFGGIADGLEWTEETIYSDYLTIKSEDYQKEFSNVEGGFTYKNAWGNIRNFMTFAIIGTALFMVLSTALDVGFFSNYTVKKYLPRLVVGTILIQFSWALGDLFIQAANQLGDLMGALLYASVPEAESYRLTNIFDGGNFMDTLIVVGAGIASWFVLLPLSITALSFFFFGFLFLVARKYLIILLLILTPLGLALWVLPGNDKAWGFYFKTFFYILLIYPVITIVTAAAKIFAYLVGSNDDTWFSTLIAFLIYVLGFAIIPFLAKRLGGVLGQFTGKANDRTKGIFDRTRNALVKRKQAGSERRKANRALKRGYKIQSGEAGRIAQARNAWERKKAGGYLFSRKLRGKSKGESRGSHGKNLAGARFETEQAKQYAAILEGTQKSMVGENLNELRQRALNDKEPLHRRTAAIVGLSKAGKASVDHLRAIKNQATSVGTEDKTLQLAMSGALKSGAFYEEGVVDAAPDLATTDIKQGVVVEADYSNLPGISIKDSVKWSASTWKAALGFDPLEKKELKELPNLKMDAESIKERSRVRETIKMVLDEEAGKLLRQQLSQDVLDLFDKVETKGSIITPSPRRTRKPRKP